MTSWDAVEKSYSYLKFNSFSLFQVMFNISSTFWLDYWKFFLRTRYDVIFLVTRDNLANLKINFKPEMRKTHCIYEKKTPYDHNII